MGGPTPGAVTGLTVTATGSALGMSWVAPASGGAPASYDVLARLSHGGPIIASVAVGNVTSFAVNAPAGAYVLSVRATNRSGAGAESNPWASPFPGFRCCRIALRTCRRR
ncbi:MAG: fibronectin type III domain-containing protein [Vicinamibacterales bacterium]